MPPISLHNPKSKDFNKPNVVTIDVGGQLFQTTIQTLTLAGSNTLFSNLFNSSEQPNRIPFIDRDPELFSIILSLLRTGNLPSKAKSFEIQDIVFEAKFYGVEDLLVQSQSNPSQFEPFDLEKSIILPLSGRDSPSAIAATPYGSVHVSHAGATDFCGLQIIDLEMGFVRQTLNWENVTKSGSTVQAIGTSPECLFTSFESSRRNSNSILVYDMNDSFKVVSEIGHNEIFGADLDSAIPSTKLNWIPSLSLLMASGSHSGASGITGNIKFWDIRSGSLVSEIKEKTDCFSDITVSDTLSAVFKIGINSGEVSYIDFRNISSDCCWNCLGDSRKVMNVKKEGIGCKIESHGNQVFSSKEGELELWSEVLMGSSSAATGRNGEEERIFKKNVLGRSKDIGGNRITNLGFGGNKMFVTRKDQQCVEVWQSSVRNII
ncbi:putative transcription factor WD40-like family [Helianthus annuus]|nr:putative transcription factor WD40-like family [Helianthus annuus]